MDLSFLPWWLLLPVGLMVVFWGLSLGSFTTCVVYRLPRGLSLWRQKNGSYRSFCPSCHAELHTRDLVPVFSWLYQRGRCRYCKTPIPTRYLLIELSVLAMVLALFAGLGLSFCFAGITLLIPVIAGGLSVLQAKYGAGGRF